jgi:hypothetical protein
VRRIGKPGRAGSRALSDQVSENDMVSACPMETFDKIIPLKNKKHPAALKTDLSLLNPDLWNLRNTDGV